MKIEQFSFFGKQSAAREVYRLKFKLKHERKNCDIPI